MPGMHEREEATKQKTDLDKLSDIVMKLAEVVARLTHEEDTLAIPEGRLEAERLVREARDLQTVEIHAASPVELLAHRMPAHVPGTATLRDAARVFVREHVGALVVQGTLATAGIITERDLVRAVASGARPYTALAVHWMHQPLIAVDANETVLAAGEKMVTSHIRHLVLAQGDRVNGVISARDVLACLLREVERV